MEDWEIDGAIDTIKRAKEIEGDLEMMRRIKVYARQQQDALREVAGLDEDRARRIGGMIHG